MSTFGPTGEFPDGALNPADAGELRMAIAVDKSKKIVVIAFGTPVTWLALSAGDTRVMGLKLLEAAGMLDRADEVIN